MSLNLGNPQDFATATQSAVGQTAGLLSQFTGGITEWDIQEASYISNESSEKGKQPIVFHVFESKQNFGGEVSEVQDTGGRRKVEYLFPYVDGQTTDDMGRDAESISINVIIHGKNYWSAWKKLRRELDKSTPGVLVHPIRGPIDVAFSDFTITHRAETRQAMTVSLQFIEHNFTIGDLSNISIDPTVKSALTRALQVFQDINNAINNVKAATIFAQTLQSQVENALEAYSNAFKEILGKLNKTYNSGSSSDIPSLAPVNQGGLLNEETGQTESDRFSSAQSPNDPFVNIPTGELNSDIIVATNTLQLEQEVNQSRQRVNSIIALYESDPTGQATLEFHEDINNLKVSALALQEALEAGKASSRTQIVNYKVPRIMSVREAMYLNGVSLTRIREVEVLNSELDSVNYVEKGTTIRIPK